MKKARQSKTIWYIIVTALGVAITAMVADDSFKELIGGWAVGLYLVDKIIQGYLRSITTTPIGSKKEEDFDNEESGEDSDPVIEIEFPKPIHTTEPEAIEPENKTTHEKNLDILEPVQADDDFVERVSNGS